eukprot:2781645-Prymnesium_polylepis.4
MANASERARSPHHPRHLRSLVSSHPAHPIDQGGGSAAPRASWLSFGSRGFERPLLAPPRRAT